MAEFPQSRTEEILYATINGEEYTGLPESRIEELLLELKEVIEEGGGGGGGTSNYNLLENLPQINSITLKGDKSLADLGIIAEIKKAMDMITGYFDNTVDYSAGDIVVYDKKLYKFTVDHTAGDWNNLEVSQTTVEELLSGKVDAVSGKGLSTNDYTNEDKGIVDGVTSALAGKADSATTLAGYGITDAYTKSSVDTALALKADKSELPDVATASDVGLVKPDGTSITVDANGVLTAVGGGGSSDPYDGRKVRYTISASSWSSSPNSDGYYTYSLTLTKALSTNTSPNVYIAGASDSTQPTATESTMFSYVKRCNLSSSTTLVLYATTKPTSTFYVFVGAEGGSSGINYSTTEHVIGTWIDGSTLYERTVNVANLPNNTSLNLESIINIHSYKIRNMFGYGYRSDTENSGNYERRPIPFAGGGENDIRFDVMGGVARIVTFSDWSPYSAYLTFQYTKS